MANALYSKAKERALASGLDLSAGTIKALLVLTGGGNYVVDLATDEVVADIGGANIIATSGAFSTKTVTLGVFDADPATFAAVAAGPAAGAIVIYQEVDGNPANDLLIEYRDSDTGMPIAPWGDDIEIVWDNGANKIFAL
jgi:hypothetical protein